ncbi:MAG: trypsin-like serine protease [Myxococcales bacterium]|nr:trypsin-like serine protease [Myxococcales bacterium]
MWGCAPSSNLVREHAQACLADQRSAAIGIANDPGRTGRWFATVYIENVESENIQVDGRGEQGICFGDSGGPIIDLDAAGAPVILGVESHGDASCVDNDWLTRLAPISDWIQSIVDEDYPEDPCMGQGSFSQCNGDLLEICWDSRFFQTNCGAFGGTCQETNRGHACSCGDIDYIGQCDGNVLVYCTEEGSLRTRDCERRRQFCGWVDDETGYNCTFSAACNPEDVGGRCQNGVAINCSDGQTTSTNCGASNLACEIGQSGAQCVARSEEPDEDMGMAADVEDDGLNFGVDLSSDASAAGQSSPQNQAEGCSQASGPDAPTSLSLLLLLLVSLRSRRRR